MTPPAGSPAYPHVIVGCFSDPGDRELIAAALRGLATFEHTNDRTHVVMRTSSRRPAALLIPCVDAKGVPMASIIRRARREAPNVPVFAVVIPRPGTSRSIARAQNAGGLVVVVRTADDLRSAIVSTVGRTTLSHNELAQLDAFLSGFGPLVLHDTLRDAVFRAHDRLTVAALARHAGASRRTMSRQSRRAGWPAPSELIAWSRLIRASIVSWRTASSITALACVAGFTGPQALRRASANLLRIARPTPSDLSPGRIGIALRARLESLQGGKPPSERRE